MSAGDVLTAVAITAAGGVTLTLAGRWLALPGSARRVNLAKAEAELLSLLPEGLAKTALAEKVERDVLYHLDLDANRVYRGLFKSALGLLGVQVACATLLGLSVINLSRHGDQSTWPSWLIPSAIGLIVASQIAEYFVMRKMGLIRTKSEERVDAEVVAAAAHGHLDLFGSGGGTPQSGGSGHIDLSGGSSEPPQAAATDHLDLGGQS